MLYYSLIWTPNSMVLFFLFFSKIMFFHLLLFICMIISIVLEGTYQVQTNLSVQTVQTSIWATRSTSRRRRGGGRGYFQKCDYPIQVRAKISNHPSTSSLGCWSGGSDWSLHDLHGEVGLHLICCLFTYSLFSSTQVENRKICCSIIISGVTSYFLI